MQTKAFASAAHEFRNPLNAISASLDLLSASILGKCETQELQYFQIARSCSNLMIFLVRDILDFAQIENHSLVLSLQVCDIY
jgi:signal transduction histidine kinase